MNKTSIFIALFAFALGFCTHLVAARWWFDPGAASTRYHWKALNDLDVHMRDPSNYEPTPYGGLVAADVPYTPEPHLAALVAAGEINHVDLVFPSVPYSRNATRLWKSFVEDHRDTIIHATGNPEYVDYRPSGSQPLHLHLWFKDAGKRNVQELIERLEHLGAANVAQVTMSSTGDRESGVL